MLSQRSERDGPFWTRIWAALVFGFFLAAAFSSFFIDHIYANSLITPVKSIAAVCSP
jgi:hypothetical protein